MHLRSLAAKRNWRKLENLLELTKRCYADKTTTINPVQITPISQHRRVVGEGPHWMEKGQSLVYTDMYSGTVHRYFNETKRHQTMHIEDAGTGSHICFIIPIEDRKDEFVVGIGKTLASIKWSPEDPDDMRRKPYPLLSLSVDLHDSQTRFNDGKCDPAGRLWGGTMAKEKEMVGHIPVIVPHKGTLYRIDSNLKSNACAQKITLSNGLAWSSDKKTLYFIDSMECSVDAFDYSHASGDMSNRRVVINFKASDIKGLPDGMTIDTEGNLWVACFGGNQVICVDPAVGKVIRNVEFASSQITSCCWGGPDYSTLFVTSAKKDIPEEKLFDSGKTFAVTGLGAKGAASAEFRVDESYFSK